MARRGKSAAFLRNLRRRYRLGEFANKANGGRRSTVRPRVSGRRASVTRRAGKRASRSSSPSSFNNPNKPGPDALERQIVRPDLSLTRTAPSDTLESGRSVGSGRYEP